MPYDPFLTSESSDMSGTIMDGFCGRVCFATWRPHAKRIGCAYSNGSVSGCGPMSLMTVSVRLGSIRKLSMSPGELCVDSRY